MSKTNFKGIIDTHYVDSTPWWPEKISAPENAPNILYVLIDDTGYADIGCYGSLIETPNLDRIAGDGLRYSDFHVNAMCSPTRASLLSGCNHHAVGMGYLANYDLGFENYRGCVDHKYGFISETLVENGYSTFALGKWHLTNDDESTGAGPFDQWPLGRGFSKFYGFHSACTNQFYPNLICGNEFVDQPGLPDEGYHVSEDLVDRAIGYIGDLKSNDADKPFFCYLAFGANHSPLQAPRAYIDHYKGAFNEGWDVYRQKVFKKQKQLGIIPDNAVLAGNDHFSRSWDSYTASEQRVLASYMEVYAAFMTHTDAQIGRVVDYLKKIGQYDNTLIVFMADNGASAEGTPWGCKNTYYHFFTEKYPEIISEDEISVLGSEHASCHYPVGWAHASNTPHKLYKSWAHNGGVKVPMILSYPDRIKDKGGIRAQYHHVVDVYKTVLDICGIEEPGLIKGVAQEEKHGISMAYTFEDPQAPRRRLTQYYEMLGNRGIWVDGWKAVADHTLNPTFDFSKDKWELFHVDEDFCESRDLSEQNPEKLRELVDLWWREAGKYGVLPMLESHLKKQEGFHSKGILRFRLAKPKKRQTIYPELSGGVGVRIPQSSYVMKVFARYKPGDEGVLVASGDNQGGFALYIQEGRLKYHNNWLSIAQWHAESDIVLTEGDHELAFDYSLLGPGDAIGRLLINGRVSARLYFDNTLASGGTVRVGRFPHVAVSEDLRSRKLFAYSNTIDRVDIEFDRPSDDLDKMREMEKELKME